MSGKAIVLDANILIHVALGKWVRVNCKQTLPNRHPLHQLCLKNSFQPHLQSLSSPYRNKYGRYPLQIK